MDTPARGHDGRRRIEDPLQVHWPDHDAALLVNRYGPNRARSGAAPSGSSVGRPHAGSPRRSSRLPAGTTSALVHDRDPIAQSLDLAEEMRVEEDRAPRAAEPRR